jgi:hypothetical protein
MPSAARGSRISRAITPAAPCPSNNPANIAPAEIPAGPIRNEAANAAASTANRISVTVPA